MLEVLGYQSLDSFIDAAVPETVRMRRPLALPPGRGENAVIATMRELTDQNEVFRSYIGLGYSNCDVPAVIRRNILENPGWYTAYTPYQAEIAQGRLEALLNFQTMVSDLTGLSVANSSLLDEGTAAAEAMAMTFAVSKHSGEGTPIYLVDSACHPQTIAVVARARWRAGSRCASTTRRISRLAMVWSAAWCSIRRRMVRCATTRRSAHARTRRERW